MPKEAGEKLIVQNKKARHDYAIEDKYEAGLALTGTEVKSLREGRASLSEADAKAKAEAEAAAAAEETPAEEAPAEAAEEAPAEAAEEAPAEA